MRAQLQGAVLAEEAEKLRERSKDLELAAHEVANQVATYKLMLEMAKQQSTDTMVSFEAQQEQAPPYSPYTPLQHHAHNEPHPSTASWLHVNPALSCRCGSWKRS